MFNEDAEGYHNAVEDVGDDAVHQGRAERIVGRLVRKPARHEHTDVGRPAVAAARDIVQRAVVRGVERAHGAVRRNARVARSVEDVARALRGGRRSCDQREQREQREHAQRHCGGLGCRVWGYLVGRRGGRGWGQLVVCEGSAKWKDVHTRSLPR